MGINKLSVALSLIPKIHYYIRKINKQQAEILVEKIGQMELMSDIENRLTSMCDSLLLCWLATFYFFNEYQ